MVKSGFSEMNSEDRQIVDKVKELASAMVTSHVKLPKLLVFSNADKVPDNLGIFIGDRVFGKTPLRTKWAHDKFVWSRYPTLEEKKDFVIERYGKDLLELRGQLLLCNCGSGATCHGKVLTLALNEYMS